MKKETEANENSAGPEHTVDELVIYLCIVDKGGKLPTVQDMNYHRAQSHLIKVDRHLCNEEVKELMKSIARTRKSPEIVGAWTGNDNCLDMPKVLNYDDLNIR